jgi:hypothetical protein
VATGAVAGERRWRKRPCPKGRPSRIAAFARRKRRSINRAIMAIFRCRVQRMPNNRRRTASTARPAATSPGPSLAGSGAILAARSGRGAGVGVAGKIATDLICTYHACIIFRKLFCKIYFGLEFLNFGETLGADLPRPVSDFASEAVLIWARKKTRR